MCLNRKLTGGVWRRPCTELSSVFIMHFSSFSPFPKSKIYPPTSPSDFGPQKEEVEVVGGACLSSRVEEEGRVLCGPLPCLLLLVGSIVVGGAPCPAFPAPFVCLRPSSGDSLRRPRFVPSLLLLLLLCCDLLLHSRCREGGAETGPRPVSQVFYAVSRPSEAFSRVRRQKQQAELSPPWWQHFATCCPVYW